MIIKKFTNLNELIEDEKKALNKVIGEVNNKVGPMQQKKQVYKTETNYTLQGGKDYRETIFTLPEDIPTNASLRNKGGHFTDIVLVIQIIFTT